MSKNRAIYCDVDQKELAKLVSALKKYPGEARKGVVSAVNKSLKTTNTAMQRAITRRYNVKKSDLANGKKFKSEASNTLIKEKKASTSDLNACIVVRASRLAFVPQRGMLNQTLPTSHKGMTRKQIKRFVKPPKVKVLRGRWKSFGAHSFVARGKGGTVGLFTRDEKTGQINMRRTTSPANMAREESVVKATQKAASDSLKKYAEHEIVYRLGKVSK